nr:tail length tape measure protein [uncultured phage]
MDEQLKVKIVVDKSDFNKGITEVKKELNSTAKSTKQGVSGVSQEVKSVAGSIKQSIATAIGVAIPQIGLVKKEIKALKNEIKGSYEGFAREFDRTYSKMYKKYKSQGLDDKTAKQKAGWSPEVNDVMGRWDKFNDSMEELAGQTSEAHVKLVELRKTVYDVATRPLQAMKRGLSSIFSTLGNGLKETSQFQALAIAFQRIKNSGFGEAVSKWAGSVKTAIKESIGAIGAWIKAIIAFAGAMTAVVFSVSKLGDSIDKGSQKMNMSTEQYQKWAYAMELSGSSIEELREGYNQMSGQISQAVNGTEESQKAFQRLGVNLKDAQGNLRSTGDIFEDVVVSLQSMDNATERTALAYKLFGESTSKLNPLLNNNGNFLKDVVRTQDALGSQMSGSLVSASAKFQDAITTMKQGWQGFKNVLGEAFLPVIQKVVVWVTVAVAKISALLRVLFGIKKDKSSETMNKATTSVSSYTGAVNKATDAVKKLKKQTMGFDEMNILQGQDSGSGSGSGAGDVGYGIDVGGSEGSIGTLLPEDALADIENFEKKMDQIGGKIAGWVTALSILGGAILLIIGALSLNIPMVLAGATLAGIGIGIGNASGTFSAWGEWLNGIWESISTWFSNTISAIGDFFSRVWNGIKEGAKAAVDAIVGFFSNIGNWFYTNVTEPVGNFFSDLWQSIKETAKAVGEWFVQAWTDIKDFFINLWNSIKEKASNTWDGIKNVFSVVGNWFYNSVISPVTNFFSGMWDKVKNGAKNAWAGIKNVFSTVAQFFGDVFSNAWKKVKDVFSTGGKIFDGIKDGIVNAFKAIVNAIISGINRVISIPFDGINWALNKIRNVSIFGLKPFDWIYTISVPQIPRLAKGGITNGATLAEIGEAGREMVLPLESNTQWMDLLADKINQRQGRSIPTKLVLQVNGRTLGETTIENINEITKQTGTLPLVFA